jgi:hypothetical protein
MSDEWDTSKEAFIQWKGTDVCMDLHCPACGYHNHYDGYFAYIVGCSKCKMLWRMNSFVTFKPYEPEPHDCPPFWGDEYDPQDDDGEPLTANPSEKQP